MSPLPKNLKITGVSVGIDWITITANEKERRETLLKKFLRLKEALVMFGEMPAAWRFHGYLGVAVGGVRWGTRKDSDILIVSGSDADAFWSTFAPLATNCTRLDLAVTARASRCYPRLLKTYIQWMRETGGAALSRMTHIEACNGIGETLYINKRNTDQMGRIYDKGAQMNEPLNVHRLWRYEIELKADRALVCFRQLLDDATASRNVHASIRKTVYEWFDSRALPPIFDKSGNGYSLDVAATVTSSAQKLAWLSSQVRPTVARLWAAGFEHEVEVALGLA